MQKLGIKAGQNVAVINLEDDAFVADLRNAGAQVTGQRARKNIDAIIFGADSRGDLRRLETLRNCLASDGALWVVRPKGIEVITEADVMAAGKAVGMVDVKVVRYSDTHTAEKFVVPLAQRRPQR